MTGSIEMGMGLLAYLTILPKRDIFADWTLQQVLALSIAPRFVVSFSSFLFQTISPLFSSSSDDNSDVTVDAATTPKKEKTVLLSMNAPFLLFVIASLAINPTSKEWSGYPSIVSKVVSILLLMEAIQFLLRPLRATQMYFQVDMNDDDKQHAKAFNRALANDLIASSLFMLCLAWNLFDSNASKIVGYLSLLNAIFLFDMAYISKTWKLVNEPGGPWLQSVYMLISLFFATGLLLS